jgi:hypothetical protein
MKKILLILLTILFIFISHEAISAPPSGYTTIASMYPKCAEVGYYGETTGIIVGGNKCAGTGYFVVLSSSQQFMPVDFLTYKNQGYDISKCKFKSVESDGHGGYATTANMSALSASAQTSTSFVGNITLPSFGYSIRLNSLLEGYKNPVDGCPLRISDEDAASIKNLKQTCSITYAYIVCPNPTSNNTNPNYIPTILPPANIPAPSNQTPPPLPNLQNTYNGQVVPMHCKGPKC